MRVGQSVGKGLRGAIRTDIRQVDNAGEVAAIGQADMDLDLALGHSQLVHRFNLLAELASTSVVGAAYRGHGSAQSSSTGEPYDSGARI